MAKKKLGIEIGNLTLKLVVVQGKRVEKVVVEELPENLVRDTMIVSWESMADFMKETMKKNGIRAKYGYVVLPEKQVFFRRVKLPAMTDEQLHTNLPYEFHEYISEDKEKYLYDYRVVEQIKDEEGVVRELDLMAIAVLKELVDRYKLLLKRVGVKAELMAPTFAAFQGLKELDERLTKQTATAAASAEAAEADGASDEGAGNAESIGGMGAESAAGGTEIADGSTDSIAFLDIGHEEMYLCFYMDGEYSTTRYMEAGLNELTSEIAAKYSTNMHTAELYKQSNYEDILTGEEAAGVYDGIAVELMRVINFYHFTNAQTHLTGVYYCGGGAAIEPLINAITAPTGVNMISIAELMKGLEISEDNAEAAVRAAAAIGITLLEEA